MLGCVAPDVLAERRDCSPCHYTKLFTYARFLPPRSGLMNLAVGFNPRVGAIIHPPSRQRRLNPDGGSLTHNVRRNQSLALVGSIVATRRGKYLTRDRGLMFFEK